MKIKVNGMDIEGDCKTLRDLLFAVADEVAPETSLKQSTCPKNKYIAHGRESAIDRRQCGADRVARDKQIVKIIMRDPKADTQKVQRQLKKNGHGFEVSDSIVYHACREAAGRRQNKRWVFHPLTITE